MTRAEKSAFAGSVLASLYPDPPVPLDYDDAFTLLVAVLLSAQCTDVRVNQVTPGLFSLARTPSEMARLGTQRIAEIIRPCGLAPAKSKALSGLSNILLDRHGGDVPRSFEALEALPGVGHKTASVVMSQAFGVPAFPVDTHIHRLARRWGLSDGSTVEKTEADLKKLFPEAEWNLLHLRIIFYGREHCPARGHSLEKCRICAKIGVKARMDG